MVPSAGFQPATPCLEGRCSIQLSYECGSYSVDNNSDSVAYQLLQKFVATREKIEHYIAVIDLCPLPAFLTDRAGTKVLFVNRAYTKLLGLNLSEVQNLRWLDAVHMDDRLQAEKGWKIFLEAQQDGVTVTNRIRYTHAATKNTISAITATTFVAGNGIVGYIIPTDCLGLLELGIDLNCEAQRAKFLHGHPQGPPSMR